MTETGFIFSTTGAAESPAKFGNRPFRKLVDSPRGAVLMLAAALTVVLAVVKGGVPAGIIILAALVGVPMLFGAMFNLEFGVVFVIISAFIVLGVKRISDDIPLGLGMDIIIALMFFGLFIKQVKERDWSFAKNEISKVILLWIVYNLLQVANPTAESREAWLYTIRGTSGYMILYFILMYVLKDRKTLNAIVITWIVMATLGALYGLSQEYIGFLPFEENWIMSDVRRFRLLFIWGHFRKFSFFSDPMVFGFVMAYTSILCLILANGPIKNYLKIMLRVISVAMIFGMIYSGTRAAYAILPAGLFFYSVLRFNKKVLIITGTLFLFGLVLVNIPTGNANLVRFQSAFKPGEDDSYKVRKKNQAFIQPYIQTHPLGGGLGSTGVWGERFSPNSPIAKFPPDSGFVRIAVEMGFIGLFLYGILLYTIFHVGIRDYLLLKDPLLKIIAAGMLVVLYTLVLGNFPQEAINQYPTSILFFSAVAIVNRLKYIEKGNK